MNVEQARFNMIEQQIRPWDVLDPAVLALLAVVKREDFLPPAYRALAFTDTEIPLGDNQFMLAPRVEARTVQELNPQRHEKVLHIGTGSGFVAALLGHRAREVFSLEIRPALARIASENLQRAGLTNVRVLEGNGAQGLAQEGPFDGILLSGSVPAVPQVLLDQLKVGGRLVAVEGQDPVMRCVVYTRQSATALSKVVVFDTVLPRLDGFDEPTRFHF